MRLAKYLDQKVSFLLEEESFEGLPIERIIDDDSVPPLVGYILRSCGLQFNCDRNNEKIRSIFIEKEKYAEKVLSEIPFSLRREEVLSLFGYPSKSGEKISNPILGNFGAWDRFQIHNYTLHIQYRIQSDGIEKITLMRNDVVPQG